MQLKSKRWHVENYQSLLVQGCRMPTHKHFYLQPRKSICNKSLPMWFAERFRVFRLLYNARGGMIRSPTPENYATVDKGFTDRATKAAISASPPNNPSLRCAINPSPSMCSWGADCTLVLRKVNHKQLLLVLLIISLLLMSLATTGLAYLPETMKLETNAPALHGTHHDETVELFLRRGPTKARARSRPFDPANKFVYYHKRRAPPRPQPSVLGFRPRIDGPLIDVRFSSD
jgi:hypothetical protein